MPDSSQRVYFHSLQKFSFLKRRRSLKRFIEALFKKEKRRLKELHYIFCTDDYLLNINQQYLHHNYYTDIITFDLSESNGIYGEVYISIDRLKENSEAYKTAYSNELHRLVFHGALHLIGYNDRTPGEKALMTKKENFYLSLFKVVPRDTVS